MAKEATSPKQQNKCENPSNLILTHLQNRQVILKVGKFFVTVGNRSRPTLGRSGPCMVTSVSKDLDDPLAPACSIKLPDASTFTPFTFIAEESASFMCRKDGNVETSLLIRLILPHDDNETSLCARYEPSVGPVVDFIPSKFGSRWKLTAIGLDKFVVESVQFKNTCLEARKYRLHLRALTKGDWDRIHHGVWDEDATCSILTKPDFAVREVGVVVR